jgi:hypothetical protein
MGVHVKKADVATVAHMCGSLIVPPWKPSNRKTFLELLFKLKGMRWSPFRTSCPDIFTVFIVDGVLRLVTIQHVKIAWSYLILLWQCTFKKKK